MLLRRKTNFPRQSTVVAWNHESNNRNERYENIIDNVKCDSIIPGIRANAVKRMELTVIRSTHKSTGLAWKLWALVNSSMKKICNFRAKDKPTNYLVGFLHQKKVQNAILKIRIFQFVSSFISASQVMVVKTKGREEFSSTKCQYVVIFREKSPTTNRELSVFKCCLDSSRFHIFTSSLISS